MSEETEINLMWTDGRSTRLPVNLDWTIEAVKTRIADQSGQPRDRLRLIVNGSRVANGTLRSNGVREGTPMYVSVAPDGAAEGGAQQGTQQPRAGRPDGTSFYVFSVSDPVPRPPPAPRIHGVTVMLHATPQDLTTLPTALRQFQTQLQALERPVAPPRPNPPFPFPFFPFSAPQGEPPPPPHPLATARPNEQAPGIADLAIAGSVALLAVAVRQQMMILSHPRNADKLMKTFGQAAENSRKLTLEQLVTSAETPPAKRERKEGYTRLMRDIGTMITPEDVADMVGGDWKVVGKLRERVACYLKEIAGADPTPQQIGETCHRSASHVTSFLKDNASAVGLSRLRDSGTCVNDVSALLRHYLQELISLFLRPVRTDADTTAFPRNVQNVLLQGLGHLIYRLSVLTPKGVSDAEQLVTASVRLYLTKHFSAKGFQNATATVGLLTNFVDSLLPNALIHYRSKRTAADDIKKQLNIYGEDEWSAIGTRLQELYNSTILNATFNPDLHPVRTTYVSRTSRSASSFFTRALQSGGQLGPCRIEPVSMYSVFSGDTTKDGDRALRFFSNCPAFQAAVLNNASHPCNAEPEAYLSGNITRVMIPRVAASLQLDAARWNLTAGDLSNFWQTCQMESAALRLPLARSVCAVFGEPDYAMWNFYEDLNKYYARGPGDVRSHEIACPLANEVLGTLFDKTRPGAEIPARASFFFAHAETVLPLLAFFGLYSTGPPLTHDMPPSAMGSRVFRSSRLSTMAVNLRFVLHNCTSTTNPAASPQYKVELLHSERQIRWPRCGGNETDVVFCSPSDLLTAACGYIFCHEHCSHKLPIPEMGYPVPVRVCIACFEKRRSKGLMGMQTNFKT
eukprot:gene15921-24351_t